MRATWVYAGTQASDGSSSAWAPAESFSLVEGQTDYLFSPGDPADTDASKALVQWGVGVLPPQDYTILADRIRLSSPPSAADAALGEPLVVRVNRSPE